MTGLPPTIDDILASIRTRMAGAEAADTPDAAAAPVESVAMPEPPSTGGSLTVEALVREALEPMLKAWLDANLPEIVEAAARAEVRRLTGKP